MGEDRLQDRLVGGVDADQEVAAELVGGKRVVTPERGQCRRCGEFRMGCGGERLRAESDGDGQITRPVGGLLGERLLRVGDARDGFAKRGQAGLEHAVVDVGHSDQAGTLRQRGQGDPGLVPADGGHRMPGALVDPRRWRRGRFAGPAQRETGGACRPRQDDSGAAAEQHAASGQPLRRLSGLRGTAIRQLPGSATSSPDSSPAVIPAPSPRSGTGRRHPGNRLCSSRLQCGLRPAASGRRCSPTAAAANSLR